MKKTCRKVNKVELQNQRKYVDLKSNDLQNHIKWYNITISTNMFFFFGEHVLIRSKGYSERSWGLICWIAMYRGFWFQVIFSIGYLYTKN